MPVAKKELKNNELFNINGLTIKKGASYKIENRFDSSAPSGFQAEKSTKLPSADVGNTIDCPFVVTNSATGAGIYDTGFYEHSPCYKNEDSGRVKEKIKAITQYVVTPYEQMKGEKDILNQKNDEFWQNYLVNLYAGKYFSADDPEDLLQLYIAMQAGELCPEDQQGNPRYKQADFVIIDKNKEKTVKQKKAISNITAIGKFYILLNENPQKLLHTLRYVGVANVNEKTDSTNLMTMFQAWLEKSDRNAEIFEDLLDKLEEPGQEEVVYMFSTIKKLFETKKVITKTGAGDYVYKGIPLGKDLKTVAKNLVLSPDLGDVKAELIAE